MLKKYCAIALALFVAATPFVFGQEKTVSLSVTAAKLVADGTIGAGEYPVTVDLGKASLGLSLSADTLYIGLSGKTDGWVSVGLGSKKMAGSTMFIGFQNGDTGQLKIQKGAGHGHDDLESDALRGYAIKAGGGATVLELAVKSGSFITKGLKELPLTVAIGAKKDFATYHGMARYVVNVNLVQ